MECQKKREVTVCNRPVFLSPNGCSNRPCGMSERIHASFNNRPSGGDIPSKTSGPYAQRHGKAHVRCGGTVALVSE